MAKPQPKIAVIGPSQSGKTCLATGLYNVRGRRLAVSAPNRESKRYLEAHTQELRNGGWPEATVPGTQANILLDFHARGVSTRVSFIEFAGELLARDETFIPFANEHFRGLDGVVLLVNPGADAFASADCFGEYLSQYRRILEFLADPNNGAKPRVALVVTAADRLQGDLKDSEGAARFQDCREGIEAELSNRGFDPKTFEVTITGPLADQDKPRLAPQGEITAAEPFLWLVDRITDYPERVKKRKRRAIIATLAAVLVLIGGCWFHLARNDREAAQLDKCKSALNEDDWDTPPNESNLSEATDALAMLRTNHWSEAHTTEVAGLLATKEPLVDQARCKHAVRNPDLHELARLLDEAQTNTNLDGWTDRLEGAFGIACGKFIDEVADGVAKRGGVPIVTREDKNRIRQKAIEIGPRFKVDKALEALHRRVEEYSNPQRGACRTWADENIRSSCSRTGTNGLLRDYVKARDGQYKDNPFFTNIVRTAVYDQYGRWLEEDVEVYPSKVTVALFDGKKEARENFEQWLNRFRETCRVLAGTDDPDPDKSSWAYQFAKRAVEEGRFPEKILDAFPQTVAITRIDCRVDYGGKFPVNHERTSFKASLRVLDPEGKPGKAIPVMAGGDIREEDENKWVTVWTNGFSHKAGLFTMALHLDVVDEQNGWAKFWTCGGSRDIVFPLADVPVAALKLYKSKDKQDCWVFDKEIELERATGADKVRVGVLVYGQLERKTPGSLARDLWNEQKWRLPSQEGMTR